jgi:hypothetical protein
MLLTNDDKLLFKSDNYALLLYKDDLVFQIDGEEYNLSSQPYEPCLYISKDDKIIRIIHNSFTTDEIISSIEDGLKISAITGTLFDTHMICELLSFTINNSFYEVDLGYLEKRFCSSHIAELSDDVSYNEFKKYDACVLNYCILKIDGSYNYEQSHKEAVLFAMRKWHALLKNEYDLDISIDKSKMKATQIDAKDFFDVSSNSDGSIAKSYLDMFLNPPHGTPYTVEDFNNLNDLLFPNGFNELDIFDWSTDWSNYFDDGNEWWGARCVSIYDKSLNRFVVIGASATD